MQKKKIAILGVKFWPSRGGTSRVVEDIISQLKDQYEFTMYAYEDPKGLDHMPDVNVVQFKPYPFSFIGVFFFFWRCTNHILRHGDYDLIHVHKTDAAFFINRLAKKFRVIATSHEAPYRRDKWNALAKSYFRWMERVFMRSHAKLTVISEPLSEYYLEVYKREVQYIPNGVDIFIEPDLEAADKVLAEHQVSGPFVFFAARRVMGTKGPQHMLRALKQVNYQGQIVIAGDTTELPAFTKELEALSEGLQVKFLGLVTSKTTLMGLICRAKTFIFPSETEGMSIMLLEVGAMGTPVIASDIPENTAVFNDQELLFFQNKNPQDLAEKFTWAEANSEQFAQMGTNMTARVKREYNRELIARQYFDLYEQESKVVV